MRKDEIWSVSIQRVRAFFRAQADVTEESDNDFSFRSCRIRLGEPEPGGTGIWAARRTQIRMEGPAEDVEAIYRRFFMQFLSTGG